MLCVPFALRLCNYQEKYNFIKKYKKRFSRVWVVHIHDCKALKTIPQRWFTGAFGKWHGLVLRRGPNSPRPFNLSQIYCSRIRSWRSRSRAPEIDSSILVDLDLLPSPYALIKLTRYKFHEVRRERSEWRRLSCELAKLFRSSFINTFAQMQTIIKEKWRTLYNR